MFSSISDAGVTSLDEGLLGPSSETSSLREYRRDTIEKGTCEMGNASIQTIAS